MSFLSTEVVLDTRIETILGKICRGANTHPPPLPQADKNAYPRPSKSRLVSTIRQTWICRGEPLGVRL